MSNYSETRAPKVSSKLPKSKTMKAKNPATAELKLPPTVKRNFKKAIDSMIIEVGKELKKSQRTEKALPLAAVAAKPLAAKIGASALGKLGVGAGVGAYGTRTGWEAAAPKKTSKSIEKTKKTKGLIGAGLGGAIGAGVGGGPIGAGLGAMGGGALGAQLDKSKVSKKKVADIEKIGPITAGLVGAGIGAAAQSLKKEIDLDFVKSKSQASLRIEKAIYHLQGYEPMDDNIVRKSFHGQIPDVMKDLELRPPQTWWEKAISKALEFKSEDPIKYSLDLWYNSLDLNKAVAEEIDGKFSPKKRGEEEGVSDGTRLDTEDLNPNEKLVTN